MIATEADIHNHNAIKRQALAQGKSVAVSLDKRGNTNFTIVPHVFDSCAKLKAFADSNKHASFNLFQGTVK